MVLIFDIIPWWLIAIVVGFTLLAWYIRLNDRRFAQLPTVLASRAPPLTPEAVRAAAKEFASHPKDITSQLPPRTGRKYIVVGGGGFLGGWIINQLLERGENPENIRVLDVNMKPANFVVSDAIKRGLQYLKTDITNLHSVETAFNHPWSTGANNGITVFHTAAVIRYFEHHPMLLSRSSRVNVDGLRNVLEAAKKVGVDVFVETSSSSVMIQPSRILLWPWEKEPKNFVQVSADDTPLPKTHFEHFSNYAVTKLVGEKLVRGADGSAIDGGRRKMRTGTVRPGNAIFGPRGDTYLGNYLVKRCGDPSWTFNTMQSFAYVENVALAHLLYERRLLDLIEQEKNPRNGTRQLPDIGGQAFLVTDPGPAPSFGNVYTILETLTNGECKFYGVSFTSVYFISHLFGFYHESQHRLRTLVSSSPLLSILRPIVMHLPDLKGNLLYFQPSLFNITGVSIIVDDSRARLSPEEGGLGYKGVWTTSEGIFKTAQEEYTDCVVGKLE